MIDQRDLHWTAGFLESNGNFINDFGGRSIGLRCKLRVRNKNREPLDRLRRLYGGSVVWDGSTHRYQLIGRRAVGLALTIWTLLSRSRRTRIANMVNEWRNYEPHYCLRPSPFQHYVAYDRSTRTLRRVAPGEGRSARAAH